MIYKKRCQKLKRYARQFCDTVRQDFKDARQTRVKITSDNPALRFYRERGCVILSNEKIKELDLTGLELANKRATGEILIDGCYNDGIIEVYNVTKENPKYLKRTIRHECLHFLLDKSGLPFNDNDNLFIMLAYLYEANPVELLKRPDLMSEINNINGREA